VQALGSAKFDGMPRSAIEAGLADVVAPVGELPGKILAFRQHAPHLRRPEPLIGLRAAASADRQRFSLYKRSTIYRRIERRMGLHQIDSIAHYVRFLRENPREIDLLFKELLIGVTSFFPTRRPGHLKAEVVPALLASRSSGGVLRAWVPGCSTGEEAYSLAMVFKEAVEPIAAVRNVALQIFATDLDRDAIEKARQGVYPDNIAADVSPERLRRFFVQEERGYRVGKEIREMVVFAPQNIIMDPPFTKLDLLSCRNLLIYLSSELQKKLIPLFHYSLNPGGVLFLGSAETVGGFTTSSPASTARPAYRASSCRRARSPGFPSTAMAVAPPLREAEGDRPAAVPRPAPQPILQSWPTRLAQRFAPWRALQREGDV
jgi:two-component system CheB/CheR fusion protein